MSNTRNDDLHPELRGFVLPRPSGPVLALIYILFCVVPLALALGRNTAALDLWGRGAAALGIVALGAMAVQFVTSGRFETVSGHLGIDKVMAFHKITAWWVMVALILHPLAYVVPTWLDDPARGTERLISYLTLPHYRSGVIAVCALVLLVVSSILRDRLAWTYELWRATHVVLALVAVGGGVHHAVTAGRFSAGGTVHAYWWGLGLAVVLVMGILYGWRWFLLHRHPWRLASVTKRADRMWELDIQPAPGTRDFRYSAGQFVWMTEGRRRFPLFDHPFSIADSPERPGLSLIVKEAGDFTSQIGSLAPGTPIGIDGPYGEFALQMHPGQGVLLLAGGVGIAPIMGILRDMVARRDKRPVRLVYAAGRPANFVCLTEIEAAKEILDLQVLILSEEDGEGWPHELGRLSHERMRRHMEGLDPAQSVALICGPGPMVTAVSDMLLDLGLPMERVVYERFDYGGGSSRQDRKRALGYWSVGAVLAILTVGFAFLPH